MANPRPTPSQIYDGRKLLGSITDTGGGFDARDASGVLLGTFDTFKAAIDAVSATRRRA
jgi:hypothetical protein